MHWQDPRTAAHQERPVPGWTDQILAPRGVVQVELALQRWCGEGMSGRGNRGMSTSYSHLEA